MQNRTYADVERQGYKHWLWKHDHKGARENILHPLHCRTGNSLFHWSIEATIPSFLSLLFGFFDKNDGATDGCQGDIKELATKDFTYMFPES